MVKTTKRINVYEGRGIGKRTIVSAWDKKRRRMDLWGEGQTEELNWIYHVHSRWLIQFDHRNGIQLFHSGMVERTLPRNASILYIYIFSILIIIRDISYAKRSVTQYTGQYTDRIHASTQKKDNTFFFINIFRSLRLNFTTVPTRPSKQKLFPIINFCQVPPFSNGTSPIQYVTRPLHAN